MSFDLKAIRRELHMIPEPSFGEHKTRELLLKHLRTLGSLRIHLMKNSPGILVEYSHGEGAYRLFRSDMDALPIEERTGAQFSSRNPGMMHACGHDIHMTVLLGLVERITTLKPRRNLLFLFQPAEEGEGGAESVLAENIIQGFHVEAVFALHVGSGLEVGTISSREGIFFGVPQEFDVVFKGVSSHAAFPEKGVNALQTGLQFMRMMDADVAELAKTEKVIFHIGKMTSGTTRNIVSDRCALEGTHRSFGKETRDRINALIMKNCAIAAAQTGAEYKVDLLSSYDPVINDGGLLKELIGVCAKLGLDFQKAETALTGEDFGYFTSIYPGLLFWLGSGCEYPLHSDKFLADEACIEIGVRVFEQLALG